MDQLRDPRKEHNAVDVNSAARRIGRCGWGMLALSVTLYWVPVLAQKRVHNPFAKPKPAPTQPSTGSTPSTPTPSQPQQPAPQQPAPSQSPAPQPPAATP